MKVYILYPFLACLVVKCIIVNADDVKLKSKSFQRFLFNEISLHFDNSAKHELNVYLDNIKTPANISDAYSEALKEATITDRLETKILFIKQWLDLDTNRDKTQDNVYVLRNVRFLKKLKTKLLYFQEEMAEELHNLRYYHLCKQFKANQEEIKARLDYYPTTRLMRIDERNIETILKQLNLTENHVISIDLKEFGDKIYEKVKGTGSEIIDDYLLILKKLLQEIIDGDTETELKPYSETLGIFMTEINLLLSLSDFYEKHQQLYDYLQNNLTIDLQTMQNSEQGEQHSLDIFNILKNKGMDLIVAFLFSNFEFLESLHEEWALLLPQVPANFLDPKSRILKEIQLLYEDFKRDFENSNNYEAYLQATKDLQELTEKEQIDRSHIFNLLHDATQNVGALRVNIIADKCGEI
uniref:Prolyl 4-hydroxylase alpha-subunit N-terminal domain-containing protein n=1 Tax=Glossina palpalis gambiensis TaxID=67801 RepID=A0A1B0C1Y0_9MUSC